MLFVELAAQAVRGFSPSVRVALKSGYTALKCPTSLPAPMAGVVMALCFPDGRGGDVSLLAPGAKGGRVGLSLQGRAQSLWRVVRDLGGVGGLHRLNQRTNQYELVTQDAAELAQVLRTDAGLPRRAAMEHLFILGGAQLPSRRPKRPPSSSPSGRTPVALSLDEPELRRRMEALEQELGGAREARALQFRLDALQAEHFNAEAELRKGAEVAGRVAELRAEVEQSPTPKSLGLPDDIVARVHRFRDDKKRHDEAVEKLFVERQQALDEGALAVAPLRRDARFWGALFVGLGFLIAGAALDGGARAVALLAIPAFTVATLLALRFIDDLQRGSFEASKRELFAHREKKLEEEFQSMASLVRAAYDKTATETPDEFEAALARGEALHAELEAAERAYVEWQGDPAHADLGAAPARLQQEIDGVNEALLRYSEGYVRDVLEVERDLQALRDQLTPPPPPPREFAPVSTAPVEVYDDPLPAMLQLGAELFSTDVMTLWDHLRDRSLQYLKALTDQRYHGVEVTADGRSRVLAPGRVVPAGELPAKDLDMLYLSVRLTLVEKYAKLEPVPLLLEDSFGGTIEASKQPLMGRMLKHIGSLTQVLHVVAEGQVPAADVVIQL